MRTSKVVLVVHPDSKARVFLRATLEAHGYVVATGHCCRDLLCGESGPAPDVILLDRSLVSQQGLDVLSDLNRKWKDAETVFLPEEVPTSGHPAISNMLGIIDRLLKMEPTRGLLAV